MKDNKNETKEFKEYRQVINGLKRVTQLCFILFLTTFLLIFFSIKIGEFTLEVTQIGIDYDISGGYVGILCLIILGILTTLFFREYLDIKKHGLEKYCQKWYYV